MPLAPRLGNADDTKVVLNFDGGTTDLSNIDYHSFVTKVVHKVQAESDLLTQKAEYIPMKGTFKWIPLTGKRDPTKRTQAIPDIASRKQEFDNVGLVLSGYDDDTYIVDYVERNSEISVSGATHEAMYKGYRRTMSRLILSSMIQPKIMKDTKTSDAWKEGTAGRVEMALPNSRIGGRITGAGAGTSLAMPSFKTFQKIKRKFYDLNVSRSTPLCSILTPGMEEYLEGLQEYRNKDYNTAVLMDKISDPSVKSVYWMGIEWIKLEPEIAPGQVFNTKFLPATAAGNNNANELVDVADATSANAVDLGDGTSNSTAYEVIPIWSPMNIKWGSDPSLGMDKMYKVPGKRLVPVISMAEWLGATRVQDELVYNLIIPA